MFLLYLIFLHIDIAEMFCFEFSYHRRVSTVNMTARDNLLNKFVSFYLNKGSESEGAWSGERRAIKSGNSDLGVKMEFLQ